VPQDIVGVSWIRCGSQYARNEE